MALERLNLREHKRILPIKEHDRLIMNSEKFKYLNTRFSEFNNPKQSGTQRLSMEYNFSHVREGNSINITIELCFFQTDVATNDRRVVLRSQTMYASRLLPAVTIPEIYSLLLDAISRMRGFQAPAGYDSIANLVQGVRGPSPESIHQVISNFLRQVYLPLN
jgi:hypothetical protein